MLAAIWDARVKDMAKGCLWFLLLKPVTGGDDWYEIHRHARCHFKVMLIGYKQTRQLVNSAIYKDIILIIMSNREALGSHYVAQGHNMWPQCYNGKKKGSLTFQPQRSRWKNSWHLIHITLSWWRVKGTKWWRPEGSHSRVTIWVYIMEQWPLYIRRIFICLPSQACFTHARRKGMPQSSLLTLSFTLRWKNKITLSQEEESSWGPLNWVDESKMAVWLILGNEM